MVLHIPIACEYFYDYLDKVCQDIEGAIVFSLFADLRSYDKACQEELDDKYRYQKAKEIENDYLIPDGQFYVSIDSEVLTAVRMKFKSIE